VFLPLVIVITLKNSVVSTKIRTMVPCFVRLTADHFHFVRLSRVLFPCRTISEMSCGFRLSETYRSVACLVRMIGFSKYTHRSSVMSLTKIRITYKVRMVRGRGCSPIPVTAPPLRGVPLFLRGVGFEPLNPCGTGASGHTRPVKSVQSCAPTGGGRPL
jgi:hypothetical protein